MRWIGIIIALFFLSFQEKPKKIEAVKGKTSYPFWVQAPQEGEKLPLLLFLHGKSLSGTNLNRVKRYGVLRAIERGRKIDAVVMAPQLAKGAWNPDKVLELIQYAKENYAIDATRIYVCGMSLGGYGTLHFAGKYPNELTAAVAICGGGNTADSFNLAQLPLWIIHGAKDFVVPLRESSKVYEAIKKCIPEADATFTIEPNGNHGSVERYFHKDSFYDWLFKYIKAKK
ncbi:MULTISPECIES: prolyl oligopeptidase family serine peptidase [Flavobacterium]|uniref:Esterase n=2 Tax=Flavobacterium TaxID=237 RepID=A0A437U7I6_9FLAO|nr:MULTISPECIES: prolyl oligopeptidase family serine peptidase [Flavobacterium]OWP83975.1 phospholipase [Flavobacterium davisii]QYS88461.1 dienelactone hydrolase family protein [Flavobacterium davisii]RVU89599.1 phospholipase [Flavobacterium columnare]SPE77003.1 esterase [Flavobacterium columnare]